MSKQLFEEGIIVPLHKKDDKLDYKNNCVIVLLKTANKVFEKVLYNKLVPNSELVIMWYQA